MWKLALLALVPACDLYFGHNTASQPPPAEVDAAVTVVADAGSTVDAGPAAFLVDEPGMYAMASDATYLYWIDNGQFDHVANLRRVPLAGGAVETLLSTPERVYGFAVAGNSAYVAHATADVGEILRVPLDGSPVTQLATVPNPTAVAVDGDWVYYNKAYSPDGQILRVPTAGGTPQVVVASVDNPWALAARDGVLFYAEMNRGRIMRVTAGAAAEQLASGWVGTAAIDVDADGAYFVACDDGPCETPHLFAVPLGGGTVRRLVAGTFSGSNVSVRNGWVLWDNMLVPTSGGPPTPLQHVVGSIAVAATSDGYFIGDFYTGAIYRTPP